MELVSVEVSVTMIDDVQTGARFEKLRVDAGLSVKQVANAAKMSLAYLYALERGNRKWNDKLLQRLLKAVNRVSAKTSSKK